MWAIVPLLAIAYAAPDGARAFEGPYDRAGVYGVFVVVPPPGWKSPYELSEGVPIVDYPEPIGKQRNPVTAAQYGLARWSTGIKYGAVEEIAAAEQVGLWLVHHQQANGEWLYEFPDVLGPGPELTLEPPWASALAQGQAISLLTRLYRHTHEQLYLTAAEHALQPLLKTVAEGGLASRYEGGVWLEEAPTAKPIYILNGFLMTIVGLYDLADLDAGAQTLFEQTVATAAESLPAFDAGKGSSWYDLVRRYGGEQHVAPPGYGPVIVSTLELLNALSPHQAFRRYARAWAQETPIETPKETPTVTPAEAPTVTPAPNPLPSTAPEVHKSPAIPDAELASRTLVVSRAGGVKLQIRCPATELSCHGSVTLRTLRAVSTRHASKARKHVLTLAVGSFTVAGGRVTTIVLRLSATARRLIAHLHVLPARATISAHDALGASHTSHSIVTLRLRKRR